MDPFTMGLLIQGAFSIGGSLLGGNQEKDKIKADNAAKAKANLANALDTAESVSTLQVQAGLFRDQAAAARSASTRQGMLAKGSAEAQAASAGVRGASVDAVIADIDRELGWAEADLDRTVGIESFNMQTRLRSLISNARSNVYGMSKVPSSGDILQNAVVGGLLGAGQTYANQYFKFGG